MNYGRYLWRDQEVNFNCGNTQITSLGFDTYLVEGARPQIGVACADADGIWVHFQGRAYFLKKAKTAAVRRKGGADLGSGDVSAPMPGKIIQVSVKVGMQVAKGDFLVILEAMKMEHRLLAPCAGTVKRVGAQVGEIVEMGRELVNIEEKKASGGKGLSPLDP